MHQSRERGAGVPIRKEVPTRSSRTFAWSRPVIDLRAVVGGLGSCEAAHFTVLQGHENVPVMVDRRSATYGRR